MWTLKSLDMTKPLYLSVLEALERDVRDGVLRPGQRMPTHRDLARLVGVTLSTATRVYREAEKRGLVTAVVGRGTFVTVDAGKKTSVIDVEDNLLDLDLGMARPMRQSDPDLWPIARKVLHKRKLPALMCYSDPQGLAEHRGVGSDWISRFGLSVPPKNIVITAGAQHALFTICNSLFEHGDRIATDCLTYPGFKTTAQRNGLRLEGVGMDSAGMLPDELESLCNRHKIKGIYISGRVQNPTNREMSHTRRLELKNVISRHGLTLIENDPYAFLSKSQDKTISALIPENSVYISSLSKAFCAGLRIAYVAAPPGMAKMLTQGIADSMLAVSPFCAAFATECISSGLADAAIEQKQQALSKRLAVFRKAFGGHFFECSEQSMYAWLTMPPHWKGLDLEREAAKRKIRVFCAEKFAVGSNPPPEAVRLALTGVEDLANLRKALCALERLLSKPGRRAH